MKTLIGGTGGTKVSAKRSSIYLYPKLLVQGTGDQAALKQNHYTLRCPILQLKVQVLPPVAKLSLLQGFHMEIWTLDLVEGLKKIKYIL